MYIIFEEHQYEAEVVKKVLHGISELHDIKQMVSVSYVGYYFDPTLGDCVFILPKVLLNEQEQLVVDNGKVVDPKDIITPDGQKKYLSDTFRKFLYEFAVWIYRTIRVYKDANRNTDAIYYRQLPQSGSGARHKANTYLDIILSLIQFNQENQDFFLYTVKNIHAGFNKINWTRTISHSTAFVQNDSPIYLNPVNRKRQINFDEELFVIFFSILNYINDTYGFRTPICLQYELLSKQEFKQYLKGRGVSRLKEIRYKYFSDKAILLWELCYTFFDNNHQLAINTDNREYLLAKKYNIVFEAMIDELIGVPHDRIPKGLADQDDGKMIDHLYTDLALTAPEGKSREVYYIGDSKYYKKGNALGKPSLAKQYTYARNIIQWNIDLWKNNEAQRAQEEPNAKFRNIRLRPEGGTEGYDIIPNFFLSAFVDDDRQYDHRNQQGESENIQVRKERDPETGELKDKVYLSTQFENRLFDRDSLLLMYYDINFLYIVRLYARNKSSEKAAWREKVHKIFRDKVRTTLRDLFDFYAMAPLASTYAKGYIQDNLKSVIGKIYTPFDNQEFYALALDKTDTENNKQLLSELRQHFYITEKNSYTIGQDPTATLQSLGYTQGAMSDNKTEERTYLSTIDSMVNPNRKEIVVGTAKKFISGFAPNETIDLQCLRYFAPIDDHKVMGAYEIKSIKMAHLKEDPKNPWRLEFMLGTYHKYQNVAYYGDNISAAKGIALTAEQLAKRMGIAGGYPFHGFFFSFFDDKNK